jgi:hypothetical protein
MCLRTVTPAYSSGMKIMCTSMLFFYCLQQFPVFHVSSDAISPLYVTTSASIYIPFFLNEFSRSFISGRNLVVCYICVVVNRSFNDMDMLLVIVAAMSDGNRETIRNVRNPKNAIRRPSVTFESSSTATCAS